MNKTLLDLKNFNHESTDEKSTTLVHKKDGHKIILAHKSLSPTVQEQLKALYNGGEVAKKPIKMAEAGDVSEAEANQNYQNVMADSNAENALQKSLQFDPNAPIVPSDPDPTKVLQDKIQQMKNLPVMPGDSISDEDAEKMAIGEMETDKDKVDTRQAGIDKAAKDKYELDNAQAIAKNADIEKENERKAKLGIAPTAIADNPRNPAAQKYFDNDQTTANADNLPQGTPIQPGQVVGQSVSGTGEGKQPDPAGPDLSNPESMLSSAYSNQVKGAQEQAQALQQEGEAEKTAFEADAKAKNDASATYQKNMNYALNEFNSAKQAVLDGHVDPEKYWTGDAQGNGGHSKLLAGIGMILAGFNPTGKPNAAIDFLKDQMDRNIQAQARNLSSKENLLAHNMQLFGVFRDAADMTRIQQAGIMEAMLGKATATAKSPLAQAAMNNAIGSLQKEYAPIGQQFAMRRAMMDLANDPNATPDAQSHLLSYMRVVNPEMAKTMEEHTIPGVKGMSTVAIPTAAREEIISKQKLNDAGQDLLNYSMKHTNIVPGTPEYNFGVTKANAFQQMVREGLLGTVFRESEKPLLEKFVKENPAGAFKMLNTQPQIRAILDSNRMSLDAIKKGYGIHVDAPAPQYKIVNGIKYMRGPNGEAIPVK